MNTHHRHSIRLRGYDYAQSGNYFVTLCTHQRECLFGEIADDVVRLNPLGQAVQACWQALPRHFLTVELDACVIMPNHVHMVIRIFGVPRPGNASPVNLGLSVSVGDALPLRPGATPGSLAAVVGNLKSVSSRQVNHLRGTPGAPVWQRNYYEHIIRNERELNAVREYVEHNPMQWSLDRENPAVQAVAPARGVKGI